MTLHCASKIDEEREKLWDAREKLGCLLARRALLQLGGAVLTFPIMLHLAYAAPKAGVGLGFLQTKMPFWDAAGLSQGGRTLTCAMTSEILFTAV